MVLKKKETYKKRNCKYLYILTHIWSVDTWCAHTLWGEPPGSLWAVEGRRGCWGSGLACSHNWPHVLCRGVVERGEEWRRINMVLLYSLSNSISSLPFSPYLRADSLMVKGQPSGSTSYAPGFPATVEVEAAATPALLPVALQPYLQWMNSSPICSATAMLFTTTVSLAASTGHLSARRANMVIISEKLDYKLQPWHYIKIQPI